MDTPAQPRVPFDGSPDAAMRTTWLQNAGFIAAGLLVTGGLVLLLALGLSETSDCVSYVLNRPLRLAAGGKIGGRNISVLAHTLFSTSLVWVVLHVFGTCILAAFTVLTAANTRTDRATGSDGPRQTPLARRSRVGSTAFVRAAIALLLIMLSFEGALFLTDLHRLPLLGGWAHETTFIVMVCTQVVALGCCLGYTLRPHVAWPASAAGAAVASSLALWPVWGYTRQWAGEAPNTHPLGGYVVWGPVVGAAMLCLLFGLWRLARIPFGARAVVGMFALGALCLAHFLCAISAFALTPDGVIFDYNGPNAAVYMHAVLAVMDVVLIFLIVMASGSDGHLTGVVPERSGGR